VSYPGPPSRPGRSGIDPRSAIWLIAGVALVAVLVRSHRINRFSVLYFAVLIPSIILHEIAHGAVANAFGDDTAKRAGRLTLNPIAHIDPLGTIILPAILILSNTVAFGWAKPVPVNPSHLRSPRNQGILVSLAGPATNAVLFLGCALAWRFGVPNGNSIDPTQPGTPVVYQLLFLGGLANAFVGLFNLLPVPPLDGSVLLERLLPAALLPSYYRIRPFGFLVLFAILLYVPSVRNGLLNWSLSLWSHFSS
jgi:Zn-dependent protease